MVPSIEIGSPITEMIKDTAYAYATINVNIDTNPWYVKYISFKKIIKGIPNVNDHIYVLTSVFD